MLHDTAGSSERAGLIAIPAETETSVDTQANHYTMWSTGRKRANRHTRGHTHTCASTHTCAHTRACVYTYKTCTAYTTQIRHICTQILTRTNTQILAHAQKHKLTETHAHKHLQYTKKTHASALHTHTQIVQHASSVRSSRPVISVLGLILMNKCQIKACLTTRPLKEWID